MTDFDDNQNNLYIAEKTARNNHDQQLRALNFALIQNDPAKRKYVDDKLIKAYAMYMNGETSWTKMARTIGGWTPSTYSDKIGAFNRDLLLAHQWTFGLTPGARNLAADTREETITQLQNGSIAVRPYSSAPGAKPLDFKELCKFVGLDSAPLIAQTMEKHREHIAQKPNKSIDKAIALLRQHGYTVIAPQ